MVFGELVPKNLAIAQPLATARAVQGFQRGFTRSPRGPIITLLQRHRERDPAPDRRRAAGGAGLGALARGADLARAPLGRAGHAGARHRDAAAALAGVRRAHARTSHDAARARATPSAEDDPVHGRRRRRPRDRALALPGARRRTARVIGIVHVKHAVGVPFERRGEVAVAEVMDEPVLVPASLELDDLLDTLRGRRAADGARRRRVRQRRRARHARGPRRGDRRRGARRARRGRGARRAARPTARWTSPGLLRPDEVRRARRRRSCPRTRTTRRSAG